MTPSCGLPRTRRANGRARRLAAAAMIAALVCTGTASAAGKAASAPGRVPAAAARAASGTNGLTLEEPPRYGIYYDRYEPTFYTGFAPRIPDPRRLHLHIGRGNQLRVTAVLSDAVLGDYTRDLLARERTYRALVDSGRLVLTQNRGLEAFEKVLADAGVDAMVAREPTSSPEEVVRRNLELMQKLNPGRIFRIHLDVGELLRRWAARLVPEDGARMTEARRVELLNLMLPTRLDVSASTPSTAAALDALVKHCLAAKDGKELLARGGVRDAFAQLLGSVSGEAYRVQGSDVLDAVEFTAVYPVGTLNDTINVHGRPIPLYPTPGRRSLVDHQRTHVIDHIPDEQIYSWSPWIPYIHIGTRMHDALHTLFWRMKPAETPFLAPAWRDAKDRDGNPYEYLWLLSRGPMSHGCTHVNAGHLAELRQMLPAEEAKLGSVDLFYNRSELYDVFDVDGDLAPEVVGVRYWIAYSLKNEKPDRLRAPNERCAYYDWLYAGELTCRDGEAARFAVARAGAFDDRSAVAGEEYRDIPLWEAPYEPEKVQFYRLVDVPFARELRRVGASHPFPGLESAVPAARYAAHAGPAGVHKGP